VTRALVVALVVLALFAPRTARACGVSASGAPAGICDASSVLDEKAAAARDRIGVSYGYTDSILFFTNNLRAPTERHAVMASYEHPLKNHFTLEIGAGSLLGGYLLTDLGKATFAPGVLADVSLSHLIVQSHGYAQPFVLLSFSLSGVWSQTSYAFSTTQTPYVAFDFSASVATGFSIKIKTHAITPFIAGRLFGGPVFWADRGSNVLGTDAYKYSLGPGLAVSIAHSRIGLSVGASLFGEKNLRGGASVSF
jgi:hypothetical protein